VLAVIGPAATWCPGPAQMDGRRARGLGPLSWAKAPRVKSPVTVPTTGRTRAMQTSVRMVGRPPSRPARR